MGDSIICAWLWRLNRTTFVCKLCGSCWSSGGRVAACCMDVLGFILYFTWHCLCFVHCCMTNVGDSWASENFLSVYFPRGIYWDSAQVTTVSSFFFMGSGIQTQVVRFPQQHLPTEPSPQPLDFERWICEEDGYRKNMLDKANNK